MVGVAELDPAGDVRRKQAVVHAVVTKRAVGIDDVVALGGGGEKGGDVEVQAIHIKAAQIGGGIDREKAGAERSIVEKEADGVGRGEGADERRASGSEVEQVVPAGGGAGVGGGAGAGELKGEVEPGADIHLTGGENAGAVARTEETGTADLAGSTAGAAKGLFGGR